MHPFLSVGTALLTLGQKGFLLIRNHFRFSGIKVVQSYPQKKRVITTVSNDEDIFTIATNLQSVTNPRPPEWVNGKQGIPIQANVPTQIPSFEQKLIKTGISIELPKVVYGVLSNPPDASKIEPFVATGLVTSGLSPLSILCANLSLSEISVKSNQVIAYLHLFESTDVGSIVNFGNLVDIGLPDDYSKSNWQLNLTPSKASLTLKSNKFANYLKNTTKYLPKMMMI